MKIDFDTAHFVKKVNATISNWRKNDVLCVSSLNEEFISYSSTNYIIDEIVLGEVKETNMLIHRTYTMTREPAVIVRKIEVINGVFNNKTFNLINITPGQEGYSRGMHGFEKRYSPPKIFPPFENMHIVRPDRALEIITAAKELQKKQKENLRNAEEYRQRQIQEKEKIEKQAPRIREQIGNLIDEMQNS